MSEYQIWLSMKSCLSSDLYTLIWLLFHNFTYKNINISLDAISLIKYAICLKYDIFVL